MFASNSNVKRTRRAPNGVALTILLLLWWAACREVAERAATGLLGSVAGGVFVPLLAACFLLFLVLLGFLALDIVGGRRRSLADLLDLPQRSTARDEWLTGAAVGWGIVVVAVLPLVLRRVLFVQTWFAGRAFVEALLALATLAIVTLATEAVFRGYGFRQLEASLGVNRAMWLMSGVYAVIVSFSLGSLTAFLVSFLLALLLTTGWRRTHALWVPWGLHFAWTAILGVLFGLPLFGGTELSSVIQAQVQGPRRFSGSGFGPIAAPWTVFVLLGAILVLFFVTRGFAWAYTHPPIIAAGYPMDVAPPPAHAAMEQAAPPPPLVQILPSTPQDGSKMGPLT